MSICGASMAYNLKNRFNLGNGASGIVRKAFHSRNCKMSAIKQCRSKQKHEINACLREAQSYKEFEANSNIILMCSTMVRISTVAILYIALEYMSIYTTVQWCIGVMGENSKFCILFHLRTVQCSFAWFSSRKK